MPFSAFVLLSAIIIIHMDANGAIDVRAANAFFEFLS